MTHSPQRSWCPISVQGRARDRPRKRVERSQHALPELQFDYVFLGARDEAETQAIQVMRDTKTSMMSRTTCHRKECRKCTAHRKSSRMWKSSGNILRSDVEAALKCIQAEVARIREKKTVLENSPIGDSKCKRRGRKGGSGFWRAVQGDQGRFSAEVAGENS